MNVPGGGAAPIEILRHAVRWTLTAEGCPAAEVSLTLLDDSAIQALNREYLKRDRVTDVIAFALDPEGGALLGDVYVGMEQSRRQALEEGVSETEELVRLAVHGTLHLLGWDHPDGQERDASPHYRRQEQLVREILSTDNSGAPDGVGSAPDGGVGIRVRSKTEVG